MFEKYTEKARRVIFFARYEASQFGSSYIETEHLLLGLIREDKNLTNRFFPKANASIDSIRKEIEGRTMIREKVSTSVDLPFSDESKRALNSAAEESERFSHKHIGTEHILLGLLREEKSVAAEILRERGLRLSMVREELSRGSSEKHNQARVKEPLSLVEFSRDLTEAAMYDTLDPLIGRENEIERMIQILCRRTKNNPVLIGEPGVGKTAIVEGLAQRIVNGQVPPQLLDKKILALDISLIVAGNKYRWQFEERLKTIMKELVENRNLVVFIDELHTLVGAGSAEGSLDAANILKPALSRGEIQCIGSTAPYEYRRSIEKDRSLERRFQAIKVAPPSERETVTILHGIKEKYENFHQLKYTDEAIEASVYLSNRYISDRFLPDKAIDLIDEAGARVKLQATAIPELSKAIRRSRAGLKSPRRPVGSFLFLGPTGVGKTEMAKSLASFLFGSENAMIRLDMSEYMEKHSVSKLIGSPPGYVGHEEGGQLTEKVKRSPYSVLLLDEIEKAHPDVYNILLQVFEDGQLTDSLGNTTDFKNCIIIMTSNIGARFLEKRGHLGFRTTSESDHKKTEEMIHSEVRRIFNPEFLNRLDEIILSESLTDEGLAKIVDLLIHQMNDVMKQKKLFVISKPEVRRWIVQKTCQDRSYGARPLRRAIQKYIEDPLSEALIQNRLKPDSTVELYLEADTIAFTATSPVVRH